MIEAPLYGANGKQHGSLPLPAEFFDGTVNEPVMHQAVKVFLANQRQGTHATKTRRWVVGGNAKPWRQKGTGRARQGTIRAPHWPGGGTVFGPHPRDYTQQMPRKQKQLARRSAFNARAREGALWVVDRFGVDAPKTAQLAALLKAMGLSDQKVLLLTNGVSHGLYLSGRNMPLVQVMPYADATTYHVLWSSAVVIERGALTDDAGEGSDESDAPSPKKRATARTPVAKKAAAKKPAATKTTKTPATKKPAAKAASKKKGAE